MHLKLEHSLLHPLELLSLHKAGGVLLVSSGMFKITTGTCQAEVKSWRNGISWGRKREVTTGTVPELQTALKWSMGITHIKRILILYEAELLSVGIWTWTASSNSLQNLGALPRWLQ